MRLECNAMNLLIRSLLFVVCSLPMWVGATELADRLQTQNHVLLVRHAYAPGLGDPAGYSLERCDSQRRLNQQGREQALKIGKWLRQQGVHDAEVYTSAWCRCTETAALLKFGQPEVLAALGSFFDQASQSRAQNSELQAFLAKKSRTKGMKPLILVTHHVNIREFVGQNVDSGDMVLVRIDAQGRALEHRLYPSL